MANFAPISTDLQRYLPTSLNPARSPQLTNGHGAAGEHEQPSIDCMPIGDRFIDIMHRGWDAQSEKRRESISPKCVPIFHRITITLLLQTDSQCSRKKIPSIPRLCTTRRSRIHADPIRRHAYGRNRCASPICSTWPSVLTTCPGNQEATTATSR